MYHQMSAKVEKHKVKFLTARVTHRLLLFIEHSKKKPTQNQPIEEWIRKEHKQSNFAKVAMIQQKNKQPRTRAKNLPK